MATKFNDFMRGIEQQAEAEGPEAVHSSRRSVISLISALGVKPAAGAPGQRFDPEASSDQGQDRLI